MQAMEIPRTAQKEFEMSENSITKIPAREITCGLFEEKLDAAFKFIAGDLSLPVTLVECSEKPEAAGPDAERTPFLLIFRADVEEQHLMQQTLEFHGGLHGLERGPIEDLLVNRTLRPVDKPEGAYYQVIFG